MLPKTGNMLLDGTRRFDLPAGGYAEAISVALRAELGDSHRAVKTIQRWTGASERSAKNWLAATAGPGGDYLISMLAHSDTVLEMLLLASRRMRLLELFLGAPQSRATDWSGSEPQNTARHQDAKLDQVCVPIGGPGHDPIDDFQPNERQQWFIAALAVGERETAGGIERRFCISRKTAKRDIARLKAAGLVSFVGSKRNGRYRLFQDRRHYSRS